jgi:hypothetical protein
MAQGKRRKNAQAEGEVNETRHLSGGGEDDRIPGMMRKGWVGGGEEIKGTGGD